MTDKIIDKMNMINKIYEDNYQKYTVKDKSTLSNILVDIDELRIKLMMKTSFNDLDMVEVRKSNIHGNGVFAKVDININEIITFYPVNILQLYVGNDESILRFSKKYKEIHGIDFINEFYKINKCYKYNCDNRNSIIGDPDIIDNNNYLGHMINDSMSHNKTKKSKKIYKKLSQSQSNCEFHNLGPFQLFVPVISNKNIKKDDEIFASYGIQYWDNI